MLLKVVNGEIYRDLYNSSLMKLNGWVILN